MAARDPKTIHNITLVGPDGSGKSAVIEAMLFNAKAVSTFRRISGGDSLLDKDPEELKRNCTLSTRVFNMTWDKQTLNLIDTPGSAAFLTDVKFAMQAGDSALFFVDAEEGLKEPAGKIWRLLREQNPPVGVVINKMDKPKARFQELLDEMAERFEVRPVPVNLPLGKGDNFQGVIDLITMKAERYVDDLKGVYKEEDIPAELMDEANAAREALVEAAVEIDDEVMEHYLEQGEVSQEEFYATLKKGVLSGLIVPVFACAATKNIGLTGLHDQLFDLMPNAAERPQMLIRKEEDGEPEAKDIELEGQTLGVVFKTTEDHFSGKLSYIRLYQGTLKADENMHIHPIMAKEKAGGLSIPFGLEMKKVDEAVAGDIITVAKVKDLHTGHTISTDSVDIFIGDYRIPRPVISYAVSAKDEKHEEKVFTSLAKLHEEDPTLRLDRNAQTRESLLQGMGQLHIDVNVERLERKFGVEIELAVPQVPYRETIKKSASAQGRHKKQSGGRGQFGDCHVEFSPLPRGEGFEFVDNIVGGVIPKSYIPAVEKGIAESMERGFLAGFPMQDVKARLYDGSHHSVDSSEAAFKMAGSLAFKSAMPNCNVVLLEPIMLVEISTPDEYVGAINGDISSRRGRVLGMEPAGGGMETISARIPMSEIALYAPELRSMTQGAATFTMEFDAYEEVPAHMSQKIIEEAEKRREEESK